MEMLKDIQDDILTIQPSQNPICGFDNITKHTLGIITLLIKVGPIILDTSMHFMLAC